MNDVQRPPVQVSGYRLTKGALQDAGLIGASLEQVRHVMSDSVDHKSVKNGMWLITDGLFTVTASPFDSLIVHVSRGHSFR